MMKKAALLIVLCFATAIGVLCQAKEISDKEYSTDFGWANQNSSQTPRRVITKREYFEDGKSFSTTEVIEEFLRSDLQRYSEVEKSGGKTVTLEQIQIGEIYYCRKNEGKWEQSAKACRRNSISGIAGDITEKFTMEDTTLDKQSAALYERYITYQSENPEDKVKILYYNMNKFWIDKQGLFLRQESEIGRVEPKTIGYKTITTYEYNPKNLKIEAPILSGEKKP